MALVRDILMCDSWLSNTEVFHSLKEKGNSGNETLVAQFVSNCKTPSGRENVISRLSKLINIHIYGRCGPLKCSKKPKDSSCYVALNNTYKFYLSFENSLCQVRPSQLVILFVSCTMARMNQDAWSFIYISQSGGGRLCVGKRRYRSHESNIQKWESGRVCFQRPSKFLKIIPSVSRRTT